MAPEDSKEEGSYDLCFYHWFSESFKSFLLLLMALPSSTDTLAVASLKVLAMIVYDVAMKIPETKQFPQHNIAGLISGITFVLFQSGEASMVGRNKHTHTRDTNII